MYLRELNSTQVYNYDSTELVRLLCYTDIFGCWIYKMQEVFWGLNARHVPLYITIFGKIYCGIIANKSDNEKLNLWAILTFLTIKQNILSLLNAYVLFYFRPNGLWAVEFNRNKLYVELAGHILLQILVTIHLHHCRDHLNLRAER